MPRVTRTLVLTLLIACSCALLLLQLRSLRKHLIKPHTLNPSGQLTTSHSQWQTLKKFLELAQRHRMPLFLADVATLSHLTQDALQRHPEPPPQHQGPLCSFLCGGRPVMAFALYASRWKYDAGFLLAAEQRGFELMELRGEDPRLASFDSLSGEEIPLHFLFRLHGFVIQVVFLYERSGNYLWHGALRLKAGGDRGFAPFALLDYGRHAGAYDRPELILTVLDGLDVRVPRNVSHFLEQQRHAHFLECRYREARSFLQLYPDDASPPALEFRRKAKALLHLAARALARIRVPFWISSGTCLGWFRQCGLISYSGDVDIGVFIEDFRTDMVSALTDAGLKLKHKFGKVEDSLELSFLGEDVKLDIFFFYGDGDVVWNGGTQVKSGRKFKYVFPRFSLCWAELLELKVRVPCQTLDYVKANYGATWNVPVRTWDWKSSPSNVIENGAWPPAEWAELIQVY